MNLTIPISDAAKGKLREPEVVRSISGETVERFRATSMTEEELLENEKRAEREARRGTWFRE